MGTFVYLLGLCVAMFSGAFLAGSIPLAFSFSESRLVLVSTFGSGLLLGTAFSVILPEGVETLYSAVAVQPVSSTNQPLANIPVPNAQMPVAHGGHDHGNGDSSHEDHIHDASPPDDLDIDAAVDVDADDALEQDANKPVPLKKPADLVKKPVVTAASDESVPVPLEKPKSPKGAERVKPTATGRPSLNGASDSDKDNTDGAPKALKPPTKDTEKKNAGNAKREKLNARDTHDGHDHAGHSHKSETHYEPQKYIGPSLVLGFLLMLLIDQLGVSGHGHDHSNTTTHSLPRKSSLDLPHHHAHNHGHADDKTELISSQSGSSSSSNGNGNGDQKSSSTSSATLGLVVHAAADGIALGAALSSDASSLGFIVFLAIMLHKAPSAFGLTTHLLRTLDPRGGITTRARIRSQLFMFSVAAPIGAIVTYCALVQLGFDDAVAMRIYTGSALLFSAGTFLYAATVHVLPEIYNEEGKLSREQIVALIIGVFLPHFLSVEHSH
ncbi:hypothetical protein HDU99_002589 [Rhizoclosmatium hyalinum]|nr:hypothetical protein HDU99_002589 [Rhizoclosmatium hyalinum]